MKFDSIIFDMDGVLIDVTSSYRVAIEKTANFFLEQNGFAVRATQEDISGIKNLSGFNNDWDATYILVNLLSNGIKKDKFAEIVKTLQPINKQDNKYKELQEIFQTFYLGDFLFNKFEGRNPPFNARGLILDEKCLVNIKFLGKLLDMKLKLGIVTGRPKKEALFAIENFTLQSFFPEGNIIALEDAAKDKPAPDPLLEAQRRMKVLSPIYVGDTANDVIAAKKAKMPCVFVGYRKIGDFQITDVNKLMEVLL